MRNNGHSAAGEKSLIQVLKGREGWLGVLEPPSSLEEGEMKREALSRASANGLLLLSLSQRCCRSCSALPGEAFVKILSVTHGEDSFHAAQQARRETAGGRDRTNHLAWRAIGAEPWDQSVNQSTESCAYQWVSVIRVREEGTGDYVSRWGLIGWSSLSGYKAV